MRTVYRELKEINSLVRNPPSYSICNLKKSPYKQIITKEHVQDLIGKDAPGVGSYSHERSTEAIFKKSPEWALPMAPRFESLNRLN